jgi:hypothetical protein
MIAPGLHKVANVSEPKEWEGSYGKMQTFTIKFDGDDAAYDLNRKPTSPAPTVGQMMDVGEVTPDVSGQYPAKIKLAQANGSRPGGGRSPQETAQIVRQHSQEMSIRWAHLAHERGLLPDGFKLGDLWAIVDAFDADAKGARP